ncbi:reverse transcriptase domain-containing protein [Tanacetum coccineum]
MMTTEYCPATEIQRMEQELWTLNLKGDDIEAYNNRFYELVLMCPELVSTEKKKIEKYIRGFPEGIKGNVSALKDRDSKEGCGKTYKEQPQPVQNRRQELLKVYDAAQAKGRGYAGNYHCANMNLESRAIVNSLQNVNALVWESRALQSDCPEIKTEN